jgi:hypothetical protein
MIKKIPHQSCYDFFILSFITTLSQNPSQWLNRKDQSLSSAKLKSKLCYRYFIKLSYAILFISYFYLFLSLSYFIWFYFILFYYLILFYLILFCFVLFYFIWFYFILFYLILFYFIFMLFYFILFYFISYLYHILSYHILFYILAVTLRAESVWSPHGLHHIFGWESTRNLKIWSDSVRLLADSTDSTHSARNFAESARTYGGV